MGTPGDQTKNVQFALDNGIPIVLRTFSVWSWHYFTGLTKKFKLKLDKTNFLCFNIKTVSDFLNKNLGNLSNFYEMDDFYCQKYGLCVKIESIIVCTKTSPVKMEMRKAKENC